jgi:hypothetical protein
MTAVQWTTIENAIQSWLVAGSGLAADHVIWDSPATPPSGQYISMRLSVIDQLGFDWVDRSDNILTIAALTIGSVNTANDTLSVTGHGLVTGDGPLQLTTSGTLPAPLALATGYWAVVVDANTIKLAARFIDAMASSPTVVDIVSAGTGTAALASTPTTTRAGQEIIQRIRCSRQAMLTLHCFGGSANGPGSPFAVLHDAIASYRLEGRSAALAAAGLGIDTVEPIQAIDADPSTAGYNPHAIATVHLHIVSELVETSTYIERVVETNDITHTTFQVSLT